MKYCCKVPGKVAVVFVDFSGAVLCGRPSPIMGRSPGHPVGEGLTPPAGFRNFFGQCWGFVMRCGAPGRRALRASWSTEGGPGDPPVPRCGTFSLSSRRGGACPSRRVSEFFRSTLGVRHVVRRAGLSRPTDVIVRGKRAGQETRPYGAISVM